METSANNISIALFASTLLFLILGGFAIAFTIIYKKKQQLFKETITLKELEFDNELLNSQVEIQEKTLQTISQEIHDNIGQLLTAAIMTVRTIKTEESVVLGKLELADTILAEAIKDLRHLSQSLNTERILEKGFVEAIGFELSIFKQAGIKATFDVLGEAATLMPQKELILFRVVQECISNIIKHAKAKNVTILANYLPNKLELSIEDDGIGFDVSNKVNGIGLKNIRNRSKVIGAIINISSKPDHGTFIKLTLNT